MSLIEKHYAGIIDALCADAPAAWVRIAREKDASTRETFQDEKVEACLVRFFQAELDHATPGKRGIGRSTDAVPRFGAYHRKRMLELPTEAHTELLEGMFRLAYGMYICLGMMLKDEYNAERQPDVEMMFSDWVPRIYSSSPTACGPGWPLAESIMAPIIKDFRQTLGRYDLKGGGFLQGDKTPLLMQYYMLAGWALRNLQLYTYR